ncbi:aldo/keto reductase [Microbacterium sp. RG1]|uniref:aldo/keto reductase n=1 Tax=Microbacterium sp. RG1 TaxID=2489212 RepID=UPI0010CA3333|nr:aldo/keto reductase [Microbacterium sp. RG1]QCQ16612.1 oxidoreductase [Microbacterium sp. RG1]
MTFPDTFAIGGDVPVTRIGFGTMGLTGDGVWGEPADRSAAIRVIRAAVDAGVNVIDTADSYGPAVTERLVADALRPYRDDVVIATKVGTVRTGPNVFIPLGRPEYLVQQVELSLRTLGLDTIDLMQLHRLDPAVPIADQVGALQNLREQGKIRHIGLSEVTLEQLQEAERTAPIAAVQNMYNLAVRVSQPVLDYATDRGIAFIPWFPIRTAGLTDSGSPLATVARQSGATPAQVALAWILHRSPVTIPIPGTRSITHLHENVQAGALRLTAEQMTLLDAVS